MTREQARKIAREFVRDYVKTGRQWDIVTMLPVELRPEAHFCDRPTITNIANFIHYYAWENRK
jgi:hypothetical protein